MERVCVNSRETPSVGPKSFPTVCFVCNRVFPALLLVLYIARIPITEPTMLWVAPGWRPPPYPQALACALPAHAAHARARPRTPRTRAHARA